MALSEILAAGEAVTEIGDEVEPVVVDSEEEEEEVVASVIEVKATPDSPQQSPKRTTRAGRVIKRPRYI